MAAVLDQWWRSAVVYQIYPKSFADADGDGIGDLAGIRSRLPYLTRLGVDALWISPWYRSPQADGGYDVADYRDIDPLFGSLDDAVALITEAHDLGLKVIADIVPNHTSDQHPFFREAVAGPPGGPAWGRYHCVRGAGGGTLPPNGWQSVFGGSAWDPIRDATGAPTGWWYLHLFDAAQPDLNWEHPEVAEEFAETLRFWFDRGLDGFRIDVATGLVKEPGYPQLDPTRACPYWDQPGVHPIWRSWRRIANAYRPPRAFVGEVWVDSEQALADYLRPDELHTAFNFDHLRCPWDAAALREVIDRSLRTNGLVGAATTWVLENHDVVRARTRYGLEAAGAQLPRSNVAAPPGVVPDDRRGAARARAGLLFMLGLPGSAYIYQGQELGLPEALDLPAEVRSDPAFLRTDGARGFRDGCRVPIPWSRDGAALGFSASDHPWLPMPAGWADLSVASQTDDPASMLDLTRRALRLRRAEPALGDGDLQWLSAADDPCLVARRPADGDPHVLLAMNLGEQPVHVAAEAVLVASGPVAADPSGVVLPPDTAAWLR